jgi:hypothetical protein
MTEQAKKIRDRLNMTYVNNDVLNQVIKDRSDFGFDSIYFRYAEVCDELAAYKSAYERTNPVEERRNMNCRKMHFYETLEQLIHAHEEINNDFNK